MIERLLMGSTSQEKFQEIAPFVADLGLKPHGALVRIFNQGLRENLRMYGTDRAGIDERDLRSYSSEDIHGYDRALRRLGLRLDDGLFASFFDHFAWRFSSAIFEEGALDISPHRVALAVYRADLMKALIGDQFFYFIDPSQKHQALAGILLQSPLPVETEFASLSFEAKETFLREHIDQLNSKNITIYFELAKDLVCVASARRRAELLVRAQRLFAEIEQRDVELRVIEECWKLVDLLQRHPDHSGVRPRHVSEGVHNRLHNGASAAGRAELLHILSLLDDMS